MPGLPSQLHLAIIGLLGLGCGVAVVLLVREKRRARHVALRVQRRNAEIERLRQHLLDARRLEAVGILAGGIVNNLNNLLSAVLGSARLAGQEAGVPAPARQELDRLVKAGHQAADLVRELADFYRDADQARRPQDLVPVVRDTVKLLQDIVPSTVDVRAELRVCGPVLATRAGVQQVIMSVGSGAVRGLGAAGGRLTVRLNERRLDAQAAQPADLPIGVYACLSVEITPAERHTPSPAGPPLSDGELTALCGLLGDQGGLTYSTARDGRRQTCEIWFPLIAWRVASDQDTAITAVPRIPVVPSVPEPVDDETPAATGPPRATILLVDDEEMVAQVLARGLRRLGYRVVTHLDSRTALNDFTQTPHLFDIVITDQIMPQMSGVRLAQRIHDVRPDIPVALCTGFRDSYNEQAAREAGVADFILKPTSHRALAALVDRHVLKRMEGRG